MLIYVKICSCASFIQRRLNKKYPALYPCISTFSLPKANQTTVQNHSEQSSKQDMPSLKCQRIRILLHIMQQVVLLLACIDYRNKIRVKRNLLRSSIVMPCQSAWQHLYENADSSSFTLMTGLSRYVFQTLLHTLSSRATWPRSHTGRPHSLSPSAELGLFLFYVGSTMNLKHLCLIFGTTPAVCSRSIKKMLKAIPSALRRHPFAKIEFPDLAKMTEWAKLVEKREPMATNVIGFMDG